MLVNANRAEPFAALTMRALVEYKWSLVKRRFYASFVFYLTSLGVLLAWTFKTNGEFDISSSSEKRLGYAVLWFAIIHSVQESMQLTVGSAAGIEWGWKRWLPKRLLSRQKVFASDAQKKDENEEGLEGHIKIRDDYEGSAKLNDARQRTLRFFTLLNISEVIRLALTFIVVGASLADDSSPDPHQRRSLMGVVALLHWFGIFHFLQAFPLTGRLVRMILAVVSSTLPFLMLIALMILGQAHALFVSVASSNNTTGDDSLFASTEGALYSVFSLLVLSNYDLETIWGAEQQLTTVLVFLFGSLICTLLLLNLLIAILSDTYERVQDRAYMEQELLRASIIEEVETSPLSKFSPCCRYLLELTDPCV